MADLVGTDRIGEHYMKRGYSEDCPCLHCAGIRRDREVDRKEDQEEKAGME